MLGGVFESVKILKNIVIDTTSSTARILKYNLRNIRVEDLTTMLIGDIRSIDFKKNNNIQNEMNDIIDEVITSDMIDMKALQVNNKDNEIQKLEKQKNEEYLLSIHSTKRRSRKRLHIRGKEDIIIINHEIIERIAAGLNLDKKIYDTLHAMSNKDKISIDSVSFSGGGYNCMYHIGVVRYIFENSELFKDTKYLGASGGAGIVALVLCFEHDPDRLNILQQILDFVIAMRFKNLKLHKQIDEYSRMLLQFVTEEKFNNCILNTDRCYISLTDVSCFVPKNEIKSKFSSYSQFIETLKASACIPILLDDKLRTIDKKTYLDGGLSNNLPSLDEKTLKVSCLNYPFLVADLYPKYICDISYSFIPPDEHYIMNMHDQGYNDIEKYLIDRYLKFQLIKCDRELNKCITDVIDDPNFINESNFMPK